MKMTSISPQIVTLVGSGLARVGEVLWEEVCHWGQSLRFPKFKVSRFEVSLVKASVSLIIFPGNPPTSSFS